MTIFRVIVLLIFTITAACAGGNSSLWRPYTFDGTNFAPSTAADAKSIWIRSGHFPKISVKYPNSAISDSLPPGTGAVAGICYRQTAGGKLSGQNSFAPYPDEQITIQSKADGVFVTRTDKNGYFTEYLAAGSYELFCRGIRIEIKINQGETTLAPIRGGKRMAD